MSHFKAPAASAAMGIIREMGETEFCEVVSSLVRVSWAMASGNTPLSSTSILKVGNTLVKRHESMSHLIKA